jgi:hypothetical protein
MMAVILSVKIIAYLVRTLISVLDVHHTIMYLCSMKIMHIVTYVPNTVKFVTDLIHMIVYNVNLGMS